MTFLTKYNLLLRFIVLHDAKNDEGIKSFCQEIYEVYIRVSEGHRVIFIQINY